uniref:SFRICE_027592 n=1 Tax=Spodoptera frugiperda TaxID=7108 RepID=A0A2H1WVT8_SPOFR
MVVSTVDPGLQELQRYGRLWRACPNKKKVTDDRTCILHMNFTCELTRINNPNEQQLGRKPARHDHLAWSEDPPFLRNLFSLFSKP